MKKIIFLSVFLHTCFVSFGQTYCDKNTTHDGTEVKEFQNKFTVTITVDSLFLGDKKYKIGFSKSEVFTDESPLIKINDSLGIKLNVARVVVNGEKKYLYSYTFYEKKGCWDKINFGESWGSFKPGSDVLAGLSMGTEGASDYFRFKGNINIK